MDQIVVVVDRSGSMQMIREDAEGGLNAFLEEQKNLGEARLTLAQFDNEYELVNDDIDINLFEGYKLMPRGSTALFDAIGRTAAAVRDSKVSGKRIFVIVTDGMENSSREFTTSDQILNLVNEMREDDWEFVFLAGDEEALKGSVKWGMNLDTSMAFDKSGKGARDAYRSIATYTAAVRGGATADAAVAAMDDEIATSGGTVRKAKGFSRNEGGKSS